MSIESKRKRPVSISLLDRIQHDFIQMSVQICDNFNISEMHLACKTRAGDLHVPFVSSRAKSWINMLSVLQTDGWVFPFQQCACQANCDVNFATRLHPN